MCYECCQHMAKIIRSALAVGALALAVAAHAGELRGRVIGVIDGDTLVVLDAGRNERRIRLAEIDAPENGQPFWWRSKQSLSSMCFGKEAVIEDRGRDRYGRTIGLVRCAGIDTSAEQVRRGMAWVFDRYAADAALYAIQGEAMEARRGLWVDPDPVPPWEWRAQHRH